MDMYNENLTKEQKKAEEALIAANLIKPSIPLNKQQLTSEQVQALDAQRIQQAKIAKPNQLFSLDDITLAMHELDDLQIKAQVHFILLGEIAKACKEVRQVSVDCIEVAIPRTAITYEVQHLFEDSWKFMVTDYGYKYFFSPPTKWDIKIPVIIYVYHEKFKLFDSPDRGLYGTDGFYIPNPFASYWKVRQLVRAKLQKGMPLSSDKL